MVPAGIGRAIVQDEERFALAGTENGFVEVRSCKRRAVLARSGADWLHGKVSFRQVEGFFQFEWFSHIGASAPNPLCTYGCFPVIIFPVNRRETSESVVTTYVTITSKCAAVEACNHSRALRIVTVEHPAGLCAV